MQPFTVHTGLAVSIDQPNIDTDQIIPKQFLKRIERTGFGQFLFFDQRYLDDGTPNPQFVLNQPRFAGASVLVARRNFGSGSSREHAPWALEDYGFRVLIAPSFADIFYNNCFKNGLLPIRLSEEQVDLLFQKIANQPGYRLTADLEQQVLRDEQGTIAAFELEPFRRQCLLHGWDDIALTLAREKEISAYEVAHGLD